MSSHHIVRDEQEPALLIFNTDFRDQTIKGLLEWSPTVITIAELVEGLLPYGFKIDVVIGTESEKEQIMTQLEHQQPFKYLSKNESDNVLLQALYFLNASKYKAANLLLAPDKETLDSVSPFVNQLDLVFYNQGFKWIYSKSKTFSKWLAADAVLKFRDKEIKVMQNQEPLDLAFVEGDFACEVQNEGQTTVVGNKAFWLGQSI